MGEAAHGLVRSFSSPSRDFKQGDLLRSLTTSISFGRFMTEPLDWEKWSSFSHNRTLEDVKKYSKPGSVAEKKAFFEAHYKKIAAKKAAKSPNKEKEKESPNYIHGNKSSEPSSNLGSLHIDENRVHELGNESLVEPSTNNIGNVVENKWSGSHKQPSTNLGSLHTGNVDGNETLEPGTNLGSLLIDIVDGNIHVEQKETWTEDVSLEMSNQLRHVEEQQEEAYIKDGSSSNKVSLGQTKPEISFSKTGAYKFPTPPPRKEEIGGSSSRKAVKEAMEKKKLAPQSIHMSLKCSPATKKDSLLVNPIVVASPKGKGRWTTQQTLISSSSTRKGVRQVMEKKRLAPQSIHMSLKSSRLVNTNGSSKPVNPFLVAQPTATKVSVNGVYSQENPRSKTPVNGSRTTGVKSSLSTKNAETSTLCRKKPGSTTTVPTSFSFRSEERAAKHKEFFQKLGEKGNTKETAKIQPQPKSMEKARNDHKKLRRNTALEAKPCTRDTKPASIINMKQVPLVRPHSPKRGSKPTPRQVQDAWRSSPKPKNFVEMNKKKLTSLPTKKTQENASPNIQYKLKNKY